MFAPIRRLVKGFKAACLWSKALDKTSSQDYTAALSCLRAIYQIFDTEMPSGAVTTDVNILCGNVACKIGDYDLAVAATVCALRQIINDNISEYDKQYLRYYCKKILEYCAYRGEQVFLPPDLSPFNVEFSSLDRAKVRSDFAKNFPVTS
jgi:hypothetical protein